MRPVTVIGAGLAGCEAAWTLSRCGIPVHLYEQKPLAYSPAHHSAEFANWICSNSLKAMRLNSAAGLLKEEMRRLGSVTMEAASQWQRGRWRRFGRGSGTFFPFGDPEDSVRL